MQVFQNKSLPFFFFFKWEAMDTEKEEWIKTAFKGLAQNNILKWTVFISFFYFSLVIKKHETNI